jgi:nucleoside-diphosphate kinase
MEKTLVLVKPDGVQRGLIGNILSRFENAGLKIVGMKMVWVDEEFAKRHYREDISERHGERVRKELIKYLKEGPVLAFVLEGIEAIKIVRKIVGNTPYPHEAQSGTIRGDYAHISKDYANNNAIMVRNLVHASGDKKDAELEIPLWFSESELWEYENIHDIFCLNKNKK